MIDLNKLWKSARPKLRKDLLIATGHQGVGHYSEKEFNEIPRRVRKRLAERLI